MLIQDIYQTTIDIAAQAHGEQKVPGKNYTYVVHIVNVCMEVIYAAQQESKVNQELLVQCALLHDIIEDTKTTYQEVMQLFGKVIADGVLALSKNEDIKKEKRLLDSVQRIKKQPPEIGMVKLADRITNLQKPPSYWSDEKKRKYRQDAQMILDELGHCSEYLASRLKQKIEQYCKYIDSFS